MKVKIFVVYFAICTTIAFGLNNTSFDELTLDTLKQKNVLSRTKFSLNARNIYMATINNGSLTDAQALASGFGVGVTSPRIHGFEAGISAFIVYNLWSTDLIKVDPITQGANRYEIGLFDVSHPNQRYNLFRFENLYLKYTLSKTSFTIGQIKINSPFINIQDGRMNSTMVQGIWSSFAQLDHLTINGGWIWGISPRSTTQWSPVANSFGIYTTGVNTTGLKSSYKDNIEGCSGIALANIELKPQPNFKISIWNMFVENIMNNASIELTNEKGSKVKFYQGLLYIHQNAINNGGNADQTKTYINKGTQSNSISSKLGIKNEKFNLSVNYTHITGDGRYLSPREWGRDPFYTYMARERNEGCGNVNAFSSQNTFAFLKQKLKIGGGYGLFLLPDVKNYRLNKYGLPSYHQINIDLTYNFDNFLKGMQLKFIGAYKLKQGTTYNNDKYVYNKVNMANLTFVINYNLQTVN